jgi:predicted CXXCH cytochrome family protein
VQPSEPSPTARSGRVRLLVAAAVLAAGGAAAYFLWPRQESITDDPPPDPRLAIETPYRNVRPDVAYVGDAACAPCHAAIDRSYHHHAMGRSAALPDLRTPPAKFTAFGRVEYQTDVRDGNVVHTELIPGPDGRPFATTVANVVAVIGSGTRGKSFLCARDGSLWQSAVSWFAEKPGWDASPNFTPGRHVRRAIQPECLFCHFNQASPVPGTNNLYREPIFGAQVAIGCERCHGPGALHVAERTSEKGHPAGAADTSIVNPKRLPPDLREDVCRQCHLQGESRLVRRGRGPFDYRPGLPLDQFLSIYVRHPAVTDYHKSVGQVEQSSMSKCAAGSGGKFGCMSCHDPHSTPEPAARVAFYRDRCLTCHQDRGCRLPIAERQAKGDACTVCHMPKAASSSIIHTAVTDHRILRRPDPGPPVKPTVPPGELPLTAFGTPVGWPSDPERERDLAVILARQQKLSLDVSRQIAERLKTVTDRHRGDAEAWEGLAAVRLVLGDAPGALQAAEAAVAARPDRERALVQVTEASLRAGKPERAREFARRAMAANPGEPEHRYRLALALMDEGKFADAESELQGILGIVPNYQQARAALAVCWYKQKRVADALAELSRAVAIDPVTGQELQNWFSDRTR